MDQTKIRSSKIRLHALGRQFSLGQLYDCRSERVIARKSLWSSDVISKAVKTRTKRNTTHDILTDVTFDRKLKLFDIDNDLKASILTNLVSLSGSSKYLYDEVPSNNHEKVTLHYKCTTKFEELDIENLIKAKTLCPEVFTNGIGTHVVCGIQYGGEAFFVFDSDGYQRSSMSLQEAVAKLPKIRSDKMGRLSLPRELEEQTNGIRFKLYSDFRTPHCSNRYRDAGKLFNTLSHFVDGKRTPAVPVEYLLYPLFEMDSFAAYPVSHVSVNIVSQLENTHNHLNKLMTDCINMGSMAIIKKFPGIKRDIEEFLQLLRSYKQHLQQLTGPIVTRIRTGSLTETALETVLREKEESPFRHHHLDNWVQRKFVHLKILSHEDSKTTRNTSNVVLPGPRSSQRSANKSQSLAETTLSSVVDSQSSIATTPERISEDSCLPDRSSSGNACNSDFIVCFHVNLGGKNSLTKMMKGYLQHMKSGFLRKAVKFPLFKQSFENTLQKAEQFQDFVAANQWNGRLKFTFSENSDGSGKPDVYVSVMKNGTVIHQDYQAPIAPGCPELVRSEHDKLEIKWSAPEFGSDGISNYEVLYKEVKGSCSSVVQVGDNGLEYKIRDLKAGKAYEIQVRAACEIGVSKWSSCSTLRTLPATEPGKPEAFHQVPNHVFVRWSKPQDLASNAHLKAYIISVTDVTTGETFSKETDPRSGEEATFSNLRATSRYAFKVKAHFEEGDTEESEVSDILEPKPNTVMKGRLLADSLKVNDGTIARHRLKLNETVYKLNEKIRKCELGTSCNVRTEKVVMVVGATGAGKTTLINGLVNHVLGVDWKDNFRFQLIVDNEEAIQSTQAQSQTKWITSYTLHYQEGFQVPYSLTVIDTPGFGDTSGIKRDQEITQQIRTFFTTKGDEGIDHIDAIGFVTQASLPRLTPTQQFIFDQVLSLFGKDISENIFLLVTFADGQTPPVLEGVNDAAIPYTEYFKFNNSALYAANDSGNRNQHMPTNNSDVSRSDNDDPDFDEMFWKMGEKSFLKFFHTLQNTQAKSILLTKDVLNERQRLETHVAGIHQHIRTGLNKLEQFRIEVDVLRRHEIDIEMNKDFEFEVTEDTVIKEKIPTKTYITNCLNCNFTCHYPCRIPEDEQKIGCAAMDKTNGFCTVCPAHCFWNVHNNCTYKLVIHQVTKTKTSEDLKVRYEAASGKKLTAEELVKKVFEDFESVQIKVLLDTNEVRKSLERLKEIALKPNPLSTVDYIDILIMSEKSKMSPGWNDRKQQLEEVRKHAETLQLLANPGFDPFEDFKTSFLDRKKTEKNPSFIQSMVNRFKHHS